MIDIENVKNEIKKLIDKYNKLVDEKKIGKYNEEMTKKDFILPLFRALGWNVENSNEVTAEEKISKKRVDYGFRINGIPKFFLEAKALKEDLDNPKFIEQAINYAWHKGCTWAVLTDFESVKIFNAEWKISNPLQSHLKTIPYQEFLDRFDELWMLSKEGFEQGLLDKSAEKWGKKTRKIPVDKQLLSDFTRFREILSKNISKLNQDKNLSEKELDEAIQRILDRLIFIRNCEDREIEEKTLISNIREWESKGKGQLIKNLREIFTYFERQYNSEIFTKHLCDDLDIDNEILHEIIEGLYYTKDKSVSYDFSAIEADVLGNIYEQYLGHILKKTPKRAKLTKDHSHRKEQGIYYTPTYIVDYIIRNTLGELLKNKNINVEKIRVLDPACGSGSFLIKAFDVLNEYCSNNDKNYNQTEVDFKTGATFTTKVKILQNNLFGVDLDKQAVEIARLNLLLKIAEREHKLPLLEQNIKCGNSLIDNELIAEDKAFKWEQEFKDIMQEGGFDVVVQNPPYVEARQISQSYVDYYRENFKTAGNRINTFPLFIEKSINLLKEGGFLGIIVHKNSIRSNDYIKLRKFILDNCKIVKVISMGAGVFEGVTGEMVVLILQKCKDLSARLKNVVLCGEEKNILSCSGYRKLSQKIFYEIPGNRFNIFLNSDKIKILEKIKSESVELKEVAETKQGIVVGNEDKYIAKKQVSSKYKPILRGRNIGRYNLKFDNEYLFYVEGTKVLKRGKTPDLFEKDEKILTQHVSSKIVATLDTEKYYVLQTINLIFSKGKVSNRYILALINSKLLNFYYDSYFNMGAEFTTAVATENLDMLPIKIIPESQQEYLDRLVDKMLSLNKRLNEIGDKLTDERKKIEKEIEKTDLDIDEFVYNIYNINDEEKKIIEESLNK